MEQETTETRAKLANAIRTLQAKGDTATIDRLVGAYKAKYQPVVKESIPEKIANFTGGKVIAQGLGQALANPEIEKQQEEIMNQQADIQKNLIERLKQKRAAGEDTTRTEAALKMITEDILKTGNQTGDLLNQKHITGKEVIGDALQLATTAAGAKVAGAAAGEATAATTIKQGIIQGAKIGAKGGAAVGVFSGAAQGLKNNGDAREIVGDSVKGALFGAGAGAIIGAATGGISGSINARKIKNLTETTIQNHIETAKQEFANLPDEEINKLGGPEKLLAKNKEDMIMQLRSQGLDDQADKLERVSLRGVKNFDDYQELLHESVQPIGKDVKTSIDAVNPNLKGKKLSAAYKQVVTGKREITPSSIFGEQGLSPDEQTMNLGKRLSDVGLGKDPAKNMQALSQELDHTETKLSAALKGDPSMVVKANKPELFTKLDTVKGSAPLEFRIGDAQSKFDQVVDFAKKLTDSADDTIEGLRNARSAFDAQASKQFPSAYANGYIDTKTPAGSAIKAVRDALNEHLYSTAPNGSEIQDLIAREADIFRATENIVPKVQALHGKNWAEKLLHLSPRIQTALGIGTGVVGGEFLLNKLIK